MKKLSILGLLALCACATPQLKPGMTAEEIALAERIAAQENARQCNIATLSLGIVRVSLAAAINAKKPKAELRALEAAVAESEAFKNSICAHVAVPVQQ